MARTPKITTATKELPEVTENAPLLPNANSENVPLPNEGKQENMVQFGKRLIEIKPTKLKYQRDHTAALYHVLKQMPLVQFLAMPDDFLEAQGDKRSPDKMLFDWLIAVTDDVNVVRENYDELDTDTIDKCLEIFCRLNKIPADGKKQNAQMTEH